MRYFIVVFILLLCHNFSVFAQNVIEFSDEKEIFSIGKDVHFYIDHNNTMKIDEIKTKSFEKSTQEVLNFGNNSFTVWIKFKIQNKTDKILILSAESGILDAINVYRIDENNTMFAANETSAHFPMSTREFPYNYFLFELPINQGKTNEFYVKIQTDFFQVPIRVGTAKSFLISNHKIDFIEGIYFGICLVIFLYNLFLYISVRDKLYLYYIFQVFFTGIMMLQLLGYFYELPIDGLYHINKYGAIFPALAMFFATLFVISFLELRKRLPIFYYLVVFISSISVLVMIFSLSLHNYWGSVTNQANGMFAAIVIIIASAVLYKRGFKQAKFFLLAWGGYMFFLIIFILQAASFLPTNWFTSGAFQFGSATEMLLLSLALADRINIYKKNTEKAQAEIILQTQENVRLVAQQNETLEKKVEERTFEIQQINEELQVQSEELQQQKEEIEQTLEVVNMQKLLIEDKNNDIIASITYAKRIQNAILPVRSKIKSVFADSFVIYKPKDIVSGDFFWCSKQEDLVFLAVADCTGHGVSGAFMTLIGNNLLNQIIIEHKITSVSKILFELDKLLCETLQQNDENALVNDGMDISMLLYHKNIDKIYYSSAKRPLFYFLNGEFFEIKGSKYPIGSSHFDNKVFDEHIINISNDISLYLFTDGYVDQFGGAKNTKLMRKNFKNLLINNQNQSFSQQKNILSDYFENWRGVQKQTDDVLVMGIKVKKGAD